MHHLVCFCNDIGSFYFTGCGIDRDLTGDEQQAAGFYCLAVRPDRGRGIRGIDDLFFHPAKIGSFELSAKNSRGERWGRLLTAIFTSQMKIIIISEKTAPVIFRMPDTLCITVRTPMELEAHRDADFYLDLEFGIDETRISALDALLPSPVIVNAVVTTLADIGRPFIRINGWPGFLEQEVHELATPDKATAERVKSLYKRLGRSCRIVPDSPGMITARILASVINEAWYTWEAGVSSKEEIDTAMKLGTNYPYGPFEWGERIGIQRICHLLRTLSKKEPHYSPAESLQEAARALKCD
jgi:3-hydroxybutyryl-CoA dehydrogenase